jgi:hypothetical protein
MSFGEYYGALSNLGEAYKTGLDEYQRKQALSGLGVAPGEPGFLPKLGQALVGIGDINGALTVSRLQAADQDRAFQRTTSERDFDFRKTESTRAQNNADRSFGAQQEGTKFDQIYKDRAIGLQERAANAKVYPEGFQPDPNNPNALRPTPGGKADPAYIASVKAAENDAKGGASVNPYASGDAKFNGDQGKSAGFADRMFQNESLIQERERLGTDRVQQGLAKAPFGLGSYANSDEFKSYRAAKDNWIAAQLRKESGAAIGASEYDAADKQYFPQPGDPAPVLEQKRQLRRLATEGMAREGGGSYQPRMTYGDGNKVMPYTPPERPARGQQPSAQAPAQAEAPRANLVPSLDAVPEGKRFRAPDGKIYRKTNGQAVPE